MSKEEDFYMEAKPRIRMFVAENGKLRISVTQLDDAGEQAEFDSIELPLDCVTEVANAMLRLAKE